MPLHDSERCHVCNILLNTQKRGRPRRYCSDACRMRAYRRRRALKVDALRSAGLGYLVGRRWADYRSDFP